MLGKLLVMEKRGICAFTADTAVVSTANCVARYVADRPVVAYLDQLNEPGRR